MCICVRVYDCGSYVSFLFVLMFSLLHSSRSALHQRYSLIRSLTPAVSVPPRSLTLVPKAYYCIDDNRLLSHIIHTLSDPSHLLEIEENLDQINLKHILESSLPRFLRNMFTTPGPDSVSAFKRALCDNFFIGILFL